MRSGVQDKPGQDGKTLALLKIQKLAGRGSMSVILATREAEAQELVEPGRQVAVSQDGATALQSRRQRNPLSQKTKIK